MTEQKPCDLDFSYDKLFERNYGIFTHEEQENIRNAKVMLIGCGGMGGAMAIILARSGVENFVLIDPDVYEPTNTNRQLCCFEDTCGRPKAIVTKEHLVRINPGIKAETYEKEMSLESLDSLIKDDVDVLVGVADDFPFSILAMRNAKKKGIPCVIGYPTGMLARITTILPDGPEAEEPFGIPKGLNYKTLHNIMFSKKYRQMFRSTLEYYKNEGEWTDEWFENFVTTDKYPFPQIAPMTTAAASLASLEVLKVITGRWEAVAAPKYWHIKPNYASIDEFDPPDIKRRFGSVILKIKERFIG